MRSRVIALVVVSICCILVGMVFANTAFAATEAARPVLRVGAAEIVITPPAEGTFLCGSLAKSTGVHDDLYCRVLVLDDGTATVALVTMDLLGIDFVFNDWIAEEAAKQSGIDKDKVMINCSHNHNAPITIPWYGWEKDRSSPWHEEVPIKVGKAVAEAKANLQKATLHCGREPVQISCNRRLMEDGKVLMKPNPDGPMANWVDVLWAETPDGRKTAALMSYAAHPVIVHMASNLITADFPGYAVGALRQQLGNDAVCMFAQGCGADANADPWAGGFAPAEEAGKKLAQAAFQAISSPNSEIVGGRLRCLTRQIQIPLRALPELSECESVLNEWTARYEENPDYSNRERVKALREICEEVRQGNVKQKFLPFPIQIFAVGNELCIVGLPHEMFSSYELWINANSPFRHNIVLGYTNGCETYIGTDEDYALGGYETDVFPNLGAQLAYQHRMAPQPGMEQMIQTTVKEMLDELATKDR